MFRTTNPFLTVSPDGKIITQTQRPVGVRSEPKPGDPSRDYHKFYNAFIDNLLPDASRTKKISFRCLNPGDFRNTVFAWVSPDGFDSSKETELYDTLESADRKLFIWCQNGGLSTFDNIPVVRYGPSFNENDVITFIYQTGNTGENSGRLFYTRTRNGKPLGENKRLGIKLPSNLIPVIGINDLGASWQIIDPPTVLGALATSSASASSESEQCMALQGELARMRLQFQDMERQFAHSQQQLLETQRQLAHSQQQLQSRRQFNLNQLSCPICQKPFDIGAHRPMILEPCGHTLCHTCIATSEQCPFCSERKTSQIDNWFVRELDLQGKKRKRKSKKIRKW
jgi:hypothetical protein